ncbi:NnrU family protein [Ancylobacter sp. A5.8]|uniref:NnrU family protein n=1 Tax=Ancylobacter gelatini TaxID=2919920 RepID=UPI001F4D81CD|nr:NnrU family protein [Ancylobacter gelatini]MCJ8144159.1 NnrU family protein [Ancylobacter gelatini]
MILMLAGLVLFVAVHVFSARRDLRAVAVEKFGIVPYRAIHGILAVAGVLMIAYGFGMWRASGPAPLWDPPTGLRHFTLLLMLVASIAAVAALVPSHIKAWLKFPFLVAIKTWALAHLLANGDLPTIVLSLVILGWAVYMRIQAKRRGAPLPVAPKGWGGDLVAVVGGVVLYAALAFWFHPYVVGVPVMPG